MDTRSEILVLLFTDIEGSMSLCMLSHGLGCGGAAVAATEVGDSDDERESHAHDSSSAARAQPGPVLPPVACERNVERSDVPR